MRLIDADALIKNLDDAIQDAKRKNEIGDYWEDDRSNLLYYLDTAPHIDIVRCKECKHCYVDGEQVKFNACELNHNKVQSDDWFCADGEREGE